MHYPTLLTPLLGAVMAPLVWALSCMIRDNWNNFHMVLVCWLVCAYVNYKDNQAPKNLFVGSGKTAPREFACELILKSKGVGDNFFTSQRELAFADLDDFSYVEGKKIDFAELLRTKPFTVEPYCVHDETKCVIMVETPLSMDCAMVGPFYFSTQRQMARKLYAVPYEEFNRVCASLGEIDFRRLILLYNTSRCGSTLVSKAMDSMAGVQSISEPDMFTSFAHMSMECKEETKKMNEISELATSTARLLLFMRGKRYPDRPILALKFRFQCIHIAHVLKKALPGASSMFLYRNGLDVVDSMGATFINGGLYRLIRFLRADMAYVFHFSALPTHLFKLIPLFGYKGFPCSRFEHLGAVSPFVMGWLSVMEKAYESLENGDIQFAFRYEDVVAEGPALLMKVLTMAGYKPKLNPVEMSHVFNTDSQVDSVASSSRRRPNGQMSESYAYLRGKDMNSIAEVIAMHPRINHWDMILPKTISV